MGGEAYFKVSSLVLSNKFANSIAINMDYKVEATTNQDFLASVHQIVWAVFILLFFWEVKRKTTV